MELIAVIAVVAAVDAAEEMKRTGNQRQAAENVAVKR